jgi:hypothetical protein
VWSSTETTCDADRADVTDVQAEFRPRYTHRAPLTRCCLAGIRMCDGLTGHADTTVCLCRQIDEIALKEVVGNTDGYVPSSCYGVHRMGT